jgi:uncharacterized protein YgiM (DUF1202 family)
MKKNLWIVFAAITTSLLAQDATNSTPVLQAPPPEMAPAAVPPAAVPPPAVETTPTPAPVAEAPTNAPAAPKKKPAKKKATTKKAVAHKAAPELKTVPLVSGPAVVSANHVNVRSKAGLVGEVVTRMTNGQPVTVIEEIHLKKSGAEEPSAWAKILLPADTHVWVKTSYIDTNSMVVSKKLNLRAGPGENYGVVGMLIKGDAVQTIDTKGDWSQIQAPTNAYAYMAAQYLKQGEEMPMAMNEATPMPTPEAMTNAETMAPATTETPGGMPSLMDTNAPTATLPTEQTPTPNVQEPPPERIVEHEGIVRGTFSIQAPTRYELVSPDTKQIVNYLYTPSTNLDLSRYKGLHIIVTGEEGLDERWKNTPVITIQRIQVLD